MKFKTTRWRFLAYALGTLTLLLGVALLYVGNSLELFSPPAATLKRLEQEYDFHWQAAGRMDPETQTGALMKHLAAEKAIVSKILAISVLHQNNPTIALDGLTFIAQKNFFDEYGELAYELLTNYSTVYDDRFLPLCMQSNVRPKVFLPFLNALALNNPNKTLKGAATLALGRELKRLNPKESAKYLAQAKNQYGDVVIYEGGPTIAAIATGELFELQHLAIGAIAPEISGKDGLGQDLKLSMFRGNVVMVDFFGDW